ncbi:hypothetical protein HHI36_021902 [Cryptolaemus montrouzieri]|uniref:Uncharacterized protein n=1 Tax=Cryptolaemus montrouzieri TaxID=559131 RepID=A0ABD2MY51_9CUCU
MRVNFEIGSRVFRNCCRYHRRRYPMNGCYQGYGFNLDLKKDALRIDNEEIPFSDTVNDVLKVHLCEDVTLPSLSETVMAWYHGNMEKFFTHMMELCVPSEKG